MSDELPDTGATEAAAQDTPDTQPASDPQPTTQPDPLDAPITEWSDSILDLPQDAEVDPELIASFGQAAVAMGLNSRQAKELAGWQMSEVKRLVEARDAAQREALLQLWGDKAETNRLDLQKKLERLEREKGFQGFGKAFVESGAANNAVVLNGLYHLLCKFEEDKGLKGAPSAPQDQPETPLEGIRRAFAEARARG